MAEEDGGLYYAWPVGAALCRGKGLRGASSEACSLIEDLLRELANPNLHDIPTNLPFRVELWEPTNQHVRWVVAACSSVAVGHAALNSAIQKLSFPGQRFTLRNGIQVIREHVPVQPRNRLSLGFNMETGRSDTDFACALRKSGRQTEQAHSRARRASVPSGSCYEWWL